VRVVLQRVAEAAVRVDGRDLARISNGLLVLAGFGHEDDEAVAGAMARKIAGLRVFPDAQGRLQYSLLDTGGSVLAVPNFTLYGDTRRGRRPDFTAALAPPAAERLFGAFADALGEAGIVQVATGEFGAHMEVSLVNDGPVTLWLEQGPRGD